MRTKPRTWLASLLLLAIGGVTVSAPHVDPAQVTVTQAAPSAPGGGGILDPYLQAPPPTAEDVLVERLLKLGADEAAAWEVVAELAPRQAQGDATVESASSAAIARAAVSRLGLDDSLGDKAARLAGAYLDGRPVSLEGLQIPVSLQERIDELRAEGLGPELAAWLGRQDLAAAQATGDRLQRIGAALEVLDLDVDLRSRVAHALSIPKPGMLPGALDGLVEVDLDLAVPDPVVSPQLACKTCPAYHYGNFIPGPNWASHPSSIGADDCRVYRFSLTAGKSYRFTLCEGGGSATFTNAAIESSTYQNQICAAGPNGVACNGSLAMLDYTATYSGFFFVKVRNLDLVAGSYRLAYREITPTCSSCPAYNFGPFTATPVYQTHSSSIGPLECRVYRFTVTANRQYRFTLCPVDSSGVASGASSSFAANLQARNASCAFIGAAAPFACNPGEEIDVTPTASGTIYVTVRGDSIGDTGAYTLAWRDRTPCATCPAQDFGPFTPTTTYATHSSTVDPDRCKLYRFTVTAGRTYRFTFCDPDDEGRTTGASAGFDTVLEAYNASCQFLAGNDDWCGTSSQMDITPAYSGALYVRVRGDSPADSGPYTLAYRDLAGFCRTCPAFDVAPPNPTTVYQQAPPSSVDFNGGCRNYRFFLTVGNAYRFTFCDPDSGGIPSGGSATFNTVLEMRSNTCVLLGSNDDACGLQSELDYIPTYTGYHYLRVRGFDANEAGTFTLAYRQLAGICRTCPAFDFGTFTPSPFWATHPSSVAPEACRVYRFQLTAGQEYQFSLCEGGGSTTFPAELTGADPTCTPAGGSFLQCVSPTEDLTIVAATTGLHYVTVAGVGPLDTGNYVLAYRNLTAACQASCADGTFNWGPFTPTPVVNFHSDVIEPYCHKTYQFDVTMGDSYHFYTCPPGSATFDSALLLQDETTCLPVGVVNNNACIDSDATADYFATYTGILYVTVSDETGLTGGSYTLAYWQENESPANANCNDGLDNDADGFADEADPDCGSCFNSIDDDLDGIGDEAEPDCAGHSCLNNTDDDLDGSPDEFDPDCNGGVPGSCTDNLDGDGDGFADELDPDCNLGVPGSCTDNVDNDGDGAFDELDPDCNGGVPGSCADNLDGDGDGFADELDPDCNGGTPGSCSDNLDNDGDGLADEVDPDCNGGVAGACNNDIDDDLDGIPDELDPDCNGGAAGSCSDNVDNDGDGQADEVDPDCNFGFAGTCSNNVDDDADGLADEVDPDCNGGVAGSCTNSVDDDLDGIGDEAEPDCAGHSCTNNVDDDLDGLGDERDPDCGGGCTDGISNDGDLLIDCADDDCNGDPACPEAGNCTDGNDNDLDGPIDCADPDCNGDVACPEAGNCTDGNDNDLDDRADCTDSDCAGDPSCPTPPGNDECAAASVIGPALPASASQDASAATDNSADPISSCGFGNDGGSVWYTFTPLVSETVTIDTIGSDYDTVLSVWTGACGALSEAACNDDADPAEIGPSQIVMPVTMGTTYTLLIESFDHDPRGNLVLNVAPTPANDECVDAFVIGPTLPATASQDTSGATDNPLDPGNSCGSGDDGRSVWYTFTPGADATVTIDTLGSSYDTVLSVWTGACGALSEEDCNDDIGPVGPSAVTLSVTNGTTYWLLIEAFDDDPAGSLVLNIN